MKVLILGATGLLGQAVTAALAAGDGFVAIAAARDPTAAAPRMPAAARLVPCPDLRDAAALERFVLAVDPDALVNCAGCRRPIPQDPLELMALYAVLPQRLAQITARIGARLIQISSDAVFSGARGGYREDDIPDPADAYGLAKLLGEVRDSHAVTLRTSMIGPEPEGGHGLLAWFLRQSGEVRGHARAMFSGLTAPELARVVRDVVLPDSGLRGVLHVAGPAISKYALLAEIKAAYGVPATLTRDEAVTIDRSLDASRLKLLTGYQAPSWPAMIAAMRADAASLARA